jgi:hypothetical protein
LSRGAKLEAGFKTSYVHSDNDVAFYDESGASPVFDTSKSNHFIYKENIQAAYLTYSGTVRKWNYELGRINKRYLIHIDSVEKFRVYGKGRMEIVLHPDPKERIVISQLNAQGFKKWILMGENFKHSMVRGTLRWFPPPALFFHPAKTLTFIRERINL